MTIRTFQCFAAGIHTDMHGSTLVVSERDLADMAAAYDPTLRPAPLVLGHPVDDRPAYGTARGLIAEGPALFCVGDVDDDLMQLVRSKAYKNVSASFFKPGSASSPEPRVPYLKHVGFLGAVAPAVKGMQPIAFALSPGFERPSSVEFAASGASHRSDPRMQLHHAALELHRSAPGLSYTDAARRVERALSR